MFAFGRLRRQIYTPFPFPDAGLDARCRALTYHTNMNGILTKSALLYEISTCSSISSFPESCGASLRPPTIYLHLHQQRISFHHLTTADDAGFHSLVLGALVTIDHLHVLRWAIALPLHQASRQMMLSRTLRHLVRAEIMSAVYNHDRWNEAYLIAHCKSPIIDRWSPEIGNICNVHQIHQVEPPIQNEPPGLPVVRYKIWIPPSSKGKGVQKEEAENDHDTAQYAPPEFLVHHGLDALFSLKKILHGSIESVQSPNVECCQGRSQWQYHQKYQRTSVVGCDGQASNSVDDAKDKMTQSKYPDIPHKRAKTRFDDTVAHADDEKQEEGKGVTARVQNRDDNHEDLCTNIVAVNV